MKIAYISMSCFSDVDLSYVSALQQKGVDIHYFLYVNPYSINDVAINIKNFKRINGVYKACDIYSDFKKFGHIIDLNKFYVINMTDTRNFHPAAIWTNILLFFFLIKQKYKIIHITFVLKWSQCLLFILRRKLFLTIHDPIPHSTDEGAVVDRIRKINFYFIRNILILNKKQKKEFIDRYKLQKHNIFNSILGPYNYLHIYDIQKPITQKYVLFFGRISKYKGVEYLLEAMKIVHEIEPELNLIVAGSGKLYFDITEYEKLPYISFINRFIPDKELANLIKNSMFVVCPYTDATQSGVIMSAYAYIKPVVATDVGGLPEMVFHEINGLLVPPKNIKALADAMIRMTSPQLLAKFSKAIEMKYQYGSYSWNGISKGILEIYKAVISRKV